MTRKLKRSFSNAFFGLFAIIKYQRNFRIQLIFGILMIIAGILFNINEAEWVYLTLAILVVLIGEMVNTIAEYLCDLITKKKVIEVKLIKDISASVVLISSFWAVLIGIIIFVPKIL